MSYDRVDFFGKAMLVTASLLLIAMGVCLTNGWIIAAGALFVCAAISYGLTFVAVQELRRQMRVHDLTIVTEKLDKAIRDHDRAMS
jgi:uncharacterized membrane protein